MIDVEQGFFYISGTSLKKAAVTYKSLWSNQEKRKSDDTF